MATPKKKKRKSTPTRWAHEMDIRAAVFATQGYSNGQIAELLGVTRSTINKWAKTRKSFREALQFARGEDGRVTGDGKNRIRQKVPKFSDYVYSMLPDDLQDVWDDLDILRQRDTTTKEDIEQVLASTSRIARQRLFLFALVESNFSASEACRCMGMTLATVRHWVATDPDFGPLYHEIEEHKKNFFESHLVKLVKAGNPLATIFANKTKNRDRGYSERLDVHVNGKVEHVHHGSIMLSDEDVLSLPLTAQRHLLKLCHDKQRVIEGEVIEETEDAQ